MEIELRHLSEKDKEEICGWQYDGKLVGFVHRCPGTQKILKPFYGCQGIGG